MTVHDAEHLPLVVTTGDATPHRAQRRRRGPFGARREEHVPEGRDQSPSPTGVPTEAAGGARWRPRAPRELLTAEGLVPEPRRNPPSTGGDLRRPPHLHGIRARSRADPERGLVLTPGRE